MSISFSISIARANAVLARVRGLSVCVVEYLCSYHGHACQYVRLGHLGSFCERLDISVSRLRYNYHTIPNTRGRPFGFVDTYVCTFAGTWLGSSIGVCCMFLQVSVANCFTDHDLEEQLGADSRPSPASLISDKEVQRAISRVK